MNRVQHMILDRYTVVVIVVGLAMTVVWIALLCYAAFGLVF